MYQSCSLGACYSKQNICRVDALDVRQHGAGGQADHVSVRVILARGRSTCSGTLAVTLHAKSIASMGALKPALPRPPPRE